MHRLFRTLALAAAVALAALCTVGCSQSVTGPYPGFATPRATLDTFFQSALRQDYATTYACYYQAYHDKIAADEFASHRRQAAVLRGYQLDAIRTSGGTAQASVTLTFADPNVGSTATRQIHTQENLIDQGGSWRIKVW
jgi:hypothetical protein